MEIYCADCGCLVDHGERVISCDTAECCCLALPVADPMTTTAALIRTSFNARDIDALRSLLAEGATWGEDPDHDQFCHDRNDIVAHIKRLLDEGVDARITDTATGSRGIAVRLHVDWPDPEDQARPELHEVHMAFMVTDGLVTAIHGQDDGDEALAAVS